MKIKVFYTWEKDAAKFDRDFGKEIEWDIPLLDGYEYCFVGNNNRMGRSFWDVKNPKLIPNIELWDATAVLVIGWNYLSHLKAMRYFKGRIPVLFRGDSTLLDEKRAIKTGLRRMFLKWVYRHIDYGLYVGKANKAYFLKHGLQEHQLIFTPHAIDNDRFGMLTEEQEVFIKETRGLFNISINDITVVYCGKLVQKKNPLLLARAVEELGQNRLHLIIVGDGELKPELKEFVKGNEKIHLLPFQNQRMMPAVYRLGEIFCLPSAGPGETWGLAINEAMASGRAVLASDKVGCSQDLVVNNINGFIFTSNDLNSLKEKLIILISDKEQLRRMGKQSESIIKNWSCKHIVDAISNMTFT